MNRFPPGAMVVVGVLALQLLGSAAQADQIYHSHHYELSALGDASLRSGFVENIHPNGPNIGAHENYLLNGAEANTSYQVVLSIWLANTSCSGDATAAFPTAVVETNIAGNGKAQHVFTAEEGEGLHGLTFSAMWVLWADGSPVFATGCEVITLD
jgi:hypothetical protein